MHRTRGNGVGQKIGNVMVDTRGGYANGTIKKVWVPLFRNSHISQNSDIFHVTNTKAAYFHMMILICEIFSPNSIE